MFHPFPQTAIGARSTSYIPHAKERHGKGWRLRGLAAAGKPILLCSSRVQVRSLPQSSLYKWYRLSPPSTLPRAAPAVQAARPQPPVLSVRGGASRRHPALASRWRGAGGPTPGAGISGQGGSRVAWGGRTQSVEKTV